MVWEGDATVPHGAVMQRRLMYKDRPLRTGDVEGVAARSDRRRQGFGAAVPLMSSDASESAAATVPNYCRSTAPLHRD
jgi:aminoglycoside 2'-N-acetyltransferase I